MNTDVTHGGVLATNAASEIGVKPELLILSESELARFNSKIDKTERPTGCWLWTAQRCGGRYGRFWLKGKGLGAHRVAYEIAHGLLGPGMMACHRCDVMHCVNPAHLFSGSAQENVDDKMTKGRHRVISGDEHYSRRNPEKVARGDRHRSKLYPETVLRGENHPWAKHPEKIPRGQDHSRAKLTDQQVHEIRRLIARGVMNKEIGPMFGVSRTLISLIKNNRIWTHLKSPSGASAEIIEL